MTSRNLNTVKKICIGVGFVLICFLLLSTFRSKGEFSDEYDNLTGGMAIAKGGEIYKNYVSQHMPFMYYLCAIFRLLGAQTLIENRLCFYLFLSILWLFMFVRYSTDFGKITMTIFPLGYIFMMANVDIFSHMILSEQLQAQGMVLLLLEFLLFIKNKRMKISNACIISVAILFSFGSAFVSLFAIAVITAGVFYVAFSETYKETRKIGSAFHNAIQILWKPIVVSGIPFLILFVYFAFTNNLKNAVVGAYYLNTNVYSKYIGGFGASPLASVLSTVNNFFGHFIGTFNNIANAPIYAIIVLLNIAINVGFILFLKKKRMSYAVIITLFILMNGIRGFAGFHSIPYWGITMMMGAILTKEYYFAYSKIDNNNSVPSIKKIILVSVVLISIVSGFFSQFSNVVFSKNDFAKPTYGENTYEYYITKLTDEDERIFVGTLDFQLFFHTNREAVSSDILGSVAPWVDEVYGSQTLSELEAEKPKVAVFSPDYTLWGYKYDEYAAPISEYLLSNYTQLAVNGLTNLYIRNDFYQEAIKILEIEIPNISQTEAVDNIGIIDDSRQVSQVFRSTGYQIFRIQFRFGTYVRTNQSQMKLNINDLTTNEKIYSMNISLAKLNDNMLNSIDIPNVQTQKDHMYEIVLQASGSSTTDCVTVYRTEEGSADKFTYAIVDGAKQTYNLNFCVFGE